MKEPYSRTSGKEPACNAGDIRDTYSILGLGRFHRRRAWQSAPVFLSGESPWVGEPGVLQSMGSQRVGYHWSDLAYKALFPLAVTAVGQDLTTLCISTFGTISSSLFFIAYHPLRIPKISENANFSINTVFVEWISPWMCALFLHLSPVKSNRQIGLRKALNWPQYLEQQRCPFTYRKGGLSPHENN